MNLKRLLIVAEPGKDGVFDYVCSLVDSLHREHPEITVDLAYSSRRCGDSLSGLVARVEAHGGVTFNMKVGNFPEFGDLRASLGIVSLVRRRRTQLIHAQSSKAGGLCRVLRRLVPGFPPVVYTPHAYYGLDGRNDAKARFFNFIEWVLGRQDIAIADSPDEREFALRRLGLPPRRVAPIYLGVDTERFRPPTDEERRAARAEFGFSDGTPVLVTVGRESAQKNYPALYRGLDPILSNPRTNLLFFHAGAGGAALAARWLSPEARKKHRAVDFISAFERLLWAADGFILASRYEGLSLAVVSTLCCGPKMFLSRVPGNKCLARIGFGEVSWLEPEAGAADPFGVPFEERIGAAVREWLKHPVPASPAQAALARSSFDARIQMRKVFRLYRHFAATYPKQPPLRRLLIVSEPGKDGVFDYITELIGFLHRRRPEITVDLAYSSNRSGKGLMGLVEQVRAHGGEAIDLHVGNMPKPRDLVACWQLAALVRRRKTQLVHAQSSKAGGLARLVRRIVPGFPPVIYSPHAYYGLDGRRTVLARIFGFIERVLGQRGISVAISPDERDFAIRTLGIPPRKVISIQQGIDTGRFRPPTAEERRAARAEFGFPEGKTVLVTVGRESVQKNYPALYRGLDPVLADRAWNLLFFHAGAGGAALADQWLSPAARQNWKGVEFTSAVERLFWAADGFILASRYEGLSLSVLACLCSGPKIFLSAVPGNICLGKLGFSEIVWIEPAGTFATVDDPFGPLFEERIAAAIREWLRDPVPPVPDQSVRARVRFDIATQMGKLFHLYDYVTQHPDMEEVL
ncbi:Glycosyltransferase involved in cell wall bisynthesis [Verrucomicrobium sp. GAS474]|uniref:glycosyltransferase n=1 Tax=Verrucomicrobium sp. GAS474 TaxID=1882831 RepID=UPI00087A8480|nr:glycosyltransferase [Verrucomicrobium sp. GAS474]SDU00693.1 Glycosyltransferase involved in cell wall bisynthesis [Verrucomicrobium sp. GAS474]